MSSPLFKRILVFYKKSALEYFNQKGWVSQNSYQRVKDFRRFKQTHVRHYATLASIEKCLTDIEIPYVKRHRGQNVDFSRFDFIIAVGGDGTFLDAARHLTKQRILGINSDERWSVGKFCSANNKNFRNILWRIFKGRFHVCPLTRLCLKSKAKTVGIHFLNDILICHKNPAALSRYDLSIGNRCEEQRGSGLWIATASGSTGAVHSAGGKILKPTSRQWQYRPRELYTGPSSPYRLNGGILSPREKIKVRSSMREGVVYIDGSHQKIPFGFGEQITVSVSKKPLYVVS